MKSLFGLKAAMEPRAWSPREIKVLRISGGVLLVLALWAVFSLVLHRYAQEAQANVWRYWINSLCIEGDRVRCRRQDAYTADSGLPKPSFWKDHPALAAQAGCLAWNGLAAGRHLLPEARPQCGGLQPATTSNAGKP